METLLAEVRTARRLPAPKRAQAIRVAAGVSLRRLAAELGVSAAALSAWEDGRYEPRGQHRVAYIELLEALAIEVGAA